MTIKPLLVIGLHADVTQGTAEEVRRQIETLNPYINAVVISGVTALAVIPEGGDET